MGILIHSTVVKWFIIWLYFVS